MRIAMVVTPLEDLNLRLASQIGVTDIVIRYPGATVDDLRPLVDQVAAYGMQISVVEGDLPIEAVQLGRPERMRQVDEIACLLRSMGVLGISTLCYNWMFLTDWTRTSLTTPGRGGALCTEFDLRRIAELPDIAAPFIEVEALWDNLAYFLGQILPVAETAGVSLAMHPDDPPLSPLRGLRRIMTNVDAFERLSAIDTRLANGICFCQGTFAEMGADVPATIRQFGDRIKFVHVRDVRGRPEHFVETFHDEGQTDMYGAMCAYRDIGFSGVMRPDHVPTLAGEEGMGGYTMQGRLFAVGYMRGLIEATEKSIRP